MKNTKICPKCKSANIVRFDGHYDPYGEGNNLVIGFLSVVNVNRYVCCDCGFSEEWIDKEVLEKVANSKKDIREIPI